MAYIYKITNLINQKKYIGKTLKTPEERWKEHIRDSQKIENSNRPLYKAFNKYGVENFILETIEECSINEINEKEAYWIEAYGSFKYGYNATLGGDGKHYCDYDLIYGLFQKGKNITEIANITGYDVATCRIALENFKISEEERQKRGREAISKTIIQINKDTGKIIAIFPSIQKAYDSLNKQHSGHIAEVCKGKRKTAYGYKWAYGNK